jgi:hypothetical protein
MRSIGCMNWAFIFQTSVSASISPDVDPPGTVTHGSDPHILPVW